MAGYSVFTGFDETIEMAKVAIEINLQQRCHIKRQVADAIFFIQVGRV